MKIEAGKYYRTRGGDVVGPMRKSNDLINTDYPWISLYECWTDAGTMHMSDAEREADLISEVYVSDTPPVNGPYFIHPLDTPPAPRVNTTKTARDELAEKAALAMQAILNGYYINLGSTSSDGFADMWLAAERFMEARKK
jgi:hypothetical protein